MSQNPIQVGLLGSRYTVSCAYDANIPGTTIPIRTDIRLRFAGARWDKTRKVWSVPSGLDTAERLAVYKPSWSKDAINYEGNLQALLQRPSVVGKTAESSMWNFKRPPLNHQVESLNFTLACGEGMGNFSWMGTGKTKVMVDWTCILAKQERIRRALILCPSPIMGNEAREFKTDGWDHVATLSVLIAKGSADRRLKIIEEAINAQVDLSVLIINYEATLTQKVMDALLHFVHGAPSAAIADESTAIKNHMAERSKNAYALSKAAKFRMIMTGTPISERPTDAFGQFLFMDSRIFGESWIAFKSRYCIMGGFEGKEVIGYQHMDDFSRRLWCRAIRYDKSVLGLPERLGDLLSPNGPQLVEFDMPKEMAAAHKTMARELLIEVDGDEYTAPIVLTKFLRLQEITSGYIRQDDRVARFPGKNPKAELMADLLEEAQDKKAIVWCKEHEEIKIARARVEEMGIKTFEIHGEIKGHVDQVVEEFKAYDGRAVLVAQVATGGVGFTITEATLAIYFSNTFLLKDRQQTEDRLHRKGQTNHVTYYDLMAKDSIDYYILETIKRKGGVSANLMDLKAALKQWQ